MKKNIAIIGGGIGGLTAALLLSNDGHHVTLFEKSDRLGGRLKFVTENGDRIDEGPTIVLLPSMIQEIIQRGGMNPESLHFHRCDPLYTLHFPDGSKLTKMANPQEMEDEIERFATGEGLAFRRYLKDMRERFSIGKPSFLDRPFLRSRDFWTARNVLALLKLGAFRSVHADVKRYFRDPRLMDAFALQSLYIGGNPYSTPSIYSLVGFSEHEHGVWYLEGGYGGLVELFASELQRRSNVNICLNADVGGIIVSNQKISGVQLSKEVQPFDTVVFNGEFPHVSSLLASDMNKNVISDRRSFFQASSGCVLLYAGLNGTYDNRQMHEFWMGQNLNQHMDEVFRTRKLPQDPSIYTFNPSLHDSTLTQNSENSVFYALIPVPSGNKINWTEEGSLFADRILSILEDRGFPRLRSRIRWLKIRTPADAQADGLFQGGSFGLAPTLLQSGVFRPQVKPFRHIHGLYAVGASVHPGGGIPIVMQGAKIMFEMFRHDNDIRE
jgi:phytoene desaturase